MILKISGKFFNDVKVLNNKMFVKFYISTTVIGV